MLREPPCWEHFRLAQFLSLQSQEVQQIYCIHPLRHWQREQRGATATAGNWELQLHCGCSWVCWTFVSDYTVGERDFLKNERKKMPNFQSSNWASKGEARDVPPVISWEHTTWGAAPKMNVLIKQLFSDSYAFMFSKVPGALLIETLKNTPPPLPCDSALGNEPTRAEQAPLTISTAWCSHPSTNPAPFVPYESKKGCQVWLHKYSEKQQHDWKMGLNGDACPASILRCWDAKAVFEDQGEIIPCKP